MEVSVVFNALYIHDSIIFDKSFLRAQFENNEYKACFLLKDGGYSYRKKVSSK